MGQQNRIFKYDNAKFVLIVLVAVGHMADYFTGWPDVTAFAVTRQFIYAFHMPLFVFLSGLFYKDKDTAVKAFRFLFCAIGMAIVNALIKIPFGIKIEINIIRVNGVNWYLYAMAFFYIIRHIFRDINPKMLLLFSLLVMLLIGYTGALNNYLALTRVVVFLPMFLLGTMVDRNRLLEITEKKWLKSLGVAVFAVWTVFLILNRHNIEPVTILYNAGKTTYSSLPENYQRYGVLLRILWLVLNTVLSFALLCLIPNKKLPCITTFGARTLQVYFWHTPIIQALVFSGFAGIMAKTLTGQVVYLALGVVIACVLSLKPFGFPTDQIIKYSKKQ